jgi:peroxiredoxin
MGALRGRVVVLYFFPKAFTPGCTTETRRFRDNYDDLKRRGAEVIGVSLDDLATQCRFAEKNDVSFPLVADPDHAITDKYDVKWPLLPFAKRVTYIIDEAGVVRAVFHHELQVSRHLDDVVQFLDRRKPAG